MPFQPGTGAHRELSQTGYWGERCVPYLLRGFLVTWWGHTNHCCSVPSCDCTVTIKMGSGAHLCLKSLTSPASQAHKFHKLMRWGGREVTPFHKPPVGARAYAVHGERQMETKHEWGEEMAAWVRLRPWQRGAFGWEADLSCYTEVGLKVHGISSSAAGENRTERSPASTESFPGALRQREARSGREDLQE